MYDRNAKTALELERAGFKIREAESILKYDTDLLDGSKYAVLIRANELSRARGGPRCMTMPLARKNK
jgi:arginine deiminase